MITEDTCPNCGAALNGFVITTRPQIHGVVCPSCGWRHEEQEKTIRSVYQEPKQQTNYDRIISMTPEELAEWIAKMRNSLYCVLAREYGCKYPDGTCYGCWLDWLRREASDGS